MEMIQTIDQRILVWFERQRTPFWNGVMMEITDLGGHVALVLIVLFTFGLLLALGRRRTAAFVTGAAAGGSLLVEGIKLFAGRARPQLDIPTPLGHMPTTTSFPSGHSALSAVVYLTLALLVAGRIQGRRARIYLIGSSLLLTCAVGISRMYLGVHYPSDVLAGWTIGLIWALAGRWVEDHWVAFHERKVNLDEAAADGLSRS
jgi:undecaprenyl-diphosphatase